MTLCLLISSGIIHLTVRGIFNGSDEAKLQHGSRGLVHGDINCLNFIGLFCASNKSSALRECRVAGSTTPSAGATSPRQSLLALARWRGIPLQSRTGKNNEFEIRARQL